MSGSELDNGSAFPDHAFPHPGMQSLKAGGMGHIQSWKLHEDLEKSVGLAGDITAQEREFPVWAPGKAVGGRIVKAPYIS